MDYPASIPRGLKYWTWHVILTASGAFVYAVNTSWHRPPAIAGMFAGIAVFIAFYTAVWSSQWFRRRVPADGLYFRALSHAVLLRSLLGVDLAFLSLVNSATHVVPSFLKWPLALLGLPVVPDAFATAGAVEVVTALGKTAAARSLRVLVAGPDAHVRAQNLWVGDLDSLLPSFLLTLAVGVALSFVLLLLSFGCLACLKLRARATRDFVPPVQPAPL